MSEENYISSSQNINVNEIWEEALSKIAEKMTAISFDVWIKTIEPVEIKGNTLLLATPSLSSKKVLNKNYKSIITGCLNQVHSAITAVEFVIGSAQSELEEKEPEAEEEESNNNELTSYSFNPKYTFDNFVVGSSNQFVAAAAKAVAQNPGGK